MLILARRLDLPPVFSQASIVKGHTTPALRPSSCASIPCLKEAHINETPRKSVFAAGIDPNLPQFCDQGCVVKAIQDQIDVLKSTNATKRARSKALALLINFVGDLHQPLHIADNNDRGGNCVPVKFFGDEPAISTDGTKATPNLHVIWDTDMPEKIGHIRRATHDDDLTQYVDTLMSDFETDMATWKTQPVDVRAWALESHSHAVKEAYGDLPTMIDAEDPVAVNVCTDDDDVLQRMLDLDESVNQKYVDQVKPVIEGQLARAGTRLAVILNDIWHN
jgi:nuclease S1